MSKSFVELGDLAVRGGGSVDPTKHADEVFELFSIPAFDAGTPEIVAGSKIGSSKKAVSPNDVMLSRIVPHIRRAWVVSPDRGHRQIASGEWILFRSTKAWPAYLRWVLVGDDFHAAFMQTVSGVGGSLLRARPAEVFKIRIPLPPLPEQKRIAAILDAADVLRAKRRESIEQLDSLTQATFLEMFGDPVTNPKGWSLEPIERIIQKDRPITYGILKPGPEVDGGVPYIRVVDIKEGRVLVDQLRCTSKEIALQYKRSTIAVGDLLMSIRGHVGRMAIAPESVVGANITQDTARLALDAIPPQYVMQCLSLPSMQHYMSKRTKGMAVRGINLGDVKILPIPLPPLALQARFASIVESIEHQKAQLQSHLAELDALFSSLQSRAFNGELVA